MLSEIVHVGEKVDPLFVGDGRQKILKRAMIRRAFILIKTQAAAYLMKPRVLFPQKSVIGLIIKIRVLPNLGVLDDIAAILRLAQRRLLAAHRFHQPFQLAQALVTDAKALFHHVRQLIQRHIRIFRVSKDGINLVIPMIVPTRFSDEGKSIHAGKVFA